MIVVSTGCPAGVGPEVSVAAAAKTTEPCVLVGDFGTLVEAARSAGVPEQRLAPFPGVAFEPNKIWIYHAGPALEPSDRRPGAPSRRAGAATLAYLEAAYELVRAARGRALVTGPVSKQAIARSGARGAASFRGHTEWLCQRDRAKHAVMCFAAPKLVTSLVTTHLALSAVPKAITAANVSAAIRELVALLHALGERAPHVAVVSLNPHAGEGELLGTEERKTILPGMTRARRALGGSAVLVGPLGAETAYRKALAGEYDGVVAMYHDQATIPSKLVAFGETVNVTMGLSIVRTSVDHGTGYDIAWKGAADPRGMIAAIDLARRLMRA